MRSGEFAEPNDVFHNVESLTRLGSNLRMLRRKKNLSQTTVSELVGVSRGAISKYEVGHAVPALKILAGFAITYQTTIADILDGVEAGELL